MSRPEPPVVLHHRWVVASPPFAVLTHLCDPQSYVGLTPFVVRVEHCVAGADAVRYVAVERFRFLGLLRWDNPIEVTLRGDPEAGRVRQDVVSPGGVRLKSTVDLTGSADETTVDETIEVSSPRMLRGYVRRQARAAQLYRATELARRFAPPTAEASQRLEP